MQPWQAGPAGAEDNMTRKYIPVITVLAVLTLSILWTYTGSVTFGDKRAHILSELDETLRAATLSGEYKCCIDPPCKMCFLGNWIWDDGTCDCDTMIANGEWDKVCPECVHGIEEGLCKSGIDETVCL